MEKKCIAKGDVYVLLVWLFALCILIQKKPLNADYTTDPVRQAYLLRMNGNADSAKTILEGVLAKDAANATAWYELARTKHHIGLGNPQLMFGSLDDIQQHVNKAVELAPDNVTFAYYRASICYTMAYVSMMRRQPDVKQKVNEVVSAYESVLSLRPDYPQAVLYLVEILSAPEDMGGDHGKAATYAARLEGENKICFAKARELLLDENAGRTEFWHEVLQQNPENADALEQLGKAYLYKNDVEKGVIYIEQAIVADLSKTTLLLDLARFYFMSSRQNQENAAALLPKAEIAINRYLETDPIIPLKAYALNLLSWIKTGMGDKNEADQFRAQAKALDPNVSMASAIPSALLFEKPDEISTYHSYFSRPF